MRAYIPKEKKGRNRPKTVRRWTLSDENSIINFLKQNRDFEKPTAREYYTKFMEETGMDVHWKLLVYKVRNMRIVYRRAKEYEVNKKDCNDMSHEEVRNVVLKICWYVDDFDILFPNDLHSYAKTNTKESSTDDESSNQESISINENLNNSSSQFVEQVLQEQPLTELPRSLERDILAVQTGKFNYKRRKFDEDVTAKQQELELAKEKLIFEKEKFRQEIRLKEKEIDSRERLKIMELQMKERIAMRELELKEKLTLQTMEKKEYAYGNVYHNMD